jgi:hypothetical protein
MNTRRHRAIASLLLFPAMLGVACLSSLPGAAPRLDLANHTPIAVTPNVTLPPEWTPTPVLTPMDIPGWDRFEALGASLWLPESYVGGNPSRDLDGIIAQLADLGGGFAEAAEQLRQNPASYVLWIVDTSPTGSGAISNVTVVTDAYPVDMDIQAYLDDQLSQLPAEFRVIESGRVALARYPDAAAVIMEANIGGLTLRQLVYLVVHEGQVWAVTYTTGAPEFEQLRPTFDQSISTLVLEP